MDELVNFLRLHLENNLKNNLNTYIPQFERLENNDYEYIPQNEEEFYAIINNAPSSILKGLGFGCWDTINTIVKENREKIRNKALSYLNANRNYPTKFLDVDEFIWLFPYEWYDIIPDNFTVTGLYGEKFSFKRGITDNDMRFGCLGYGICKPCNL